MPKRRPRSASVYSSGPDEIHSLQEAFEQLDVHALKFVFLTRSCLPRLIWLLLFFGGCGAAGYYIYQICIDFLGHQTATKITTKIQEAYDYPPIYICPRYNWDIDKALAYNLSSDALVHAASLAQKNDTDRPLPSLKDRVLFAEDELHRFIKENPEIPRKTYADFYKWMALDSSSIIQEYAGIESKSFSSVFVASPGHDNAPVSYRACYNVSAGSFNPHTGDVFYLQYVVPERPNETMLGFDNDFAFIKDDERVVLEKDRIYLRTNRATTIRLSVKEYSRRETKESKCKSAEKIKKRYSQENCRYHCFQEIVQRCTKCKVMCDDTELIGSTNLCSWLMNSNLSTSCGEIETRAYHGCLRNCEPLCEYRSYDFSIAVAVINASNPLDPRISLSIYFLVDDGILLFEEIPLYNFQTFISNIGGQLGLWTGASILTVLELLYLLTQFFCADWEIRKVRRRHHARSESIAKEAEKEESDEEHEEKPEQNGETGDKEKDKLPVVTEDENGEVKEEKEKEKDGKHVGFETA